MKRKQVFDEKLHAQKRALRIPVPKPTTWFKDKKNYTRKEKYKDYHEDA